MALPTSEDLGALDVVYLGAPFIFVEAKSLNTGSLDIVYLGMPFFGVPPSGGVEPPVTFNAAQFFALF